MFIITKNKRTILINPESKINSLQEEKRNNQTKNLYNLIIKINKKENHAKKPYMKTLSNSEILAQAHLLKRKLKLLKGKRSNHGIT